MNPAPASTRTPPPPLSAFAHVREDRLRLTDLDFQKHVNNATITSLLAAARYDFLADAVRAHLPEGDKLVIASLEVNFLREMHYGTPVFTGTRVLSVGRTSLRMQQATYQGGTCAALGTCIFVRVEGRTGAAGAWPEAVRALAAATATGG